MAPNLPAAPAGSHPANLRPLVAAHRKMSWKMHRKMRTSGSVRARHTRPAKVAALVSRMSWPPTPGLSLLLACVAWAALLAGPADGVAQEPHVGIVSGPGPISLTAIDIFDGAISTASTTFTVKASETTVVYDVWLTVPAGNLDPVPDVYLAKNGAYSLPLNVRLTGNTGGNAVNFNAATINARPTSGKKADGDNVSGSDHDTGTTYTITLTENTNLLYKYPNMPAGVYSINFTAHVALEN